MVFGFQKWTSIFEIWRLSKTGCLFFPCFWSLLERGTIDKKKRHFCFCFWRPYWNDLMDIEITFSYLKSSVLTVVQWMITTSSWRPTIRDHDSHNTNDIWNQALQSLTCQRLLVSSEQVPRGLIPSHKNAADKISLALKDMSNLDQDEDWKLKEKLFSFDYYPVEWTSLIAFWSGSTPNYDGLCLAIM